VFQPAGDNGSMAKRKQATALTLTGFLLGAIIGEVAPEPTDPIFILIEN